MAQQSTLYQYTDTTRTTARNYNIDERTVIFAHMLAAGIDRADAYHVLFSRGKNNTHDTRAASDTAAAEHLNNNPGAKILIAKIKQRATINAQNTLEEVRRAAREEEETEEEKRERAELQTRRGIVRRLAKEVARTSGKDSVQGLISLAKLQGFDKEGTQKEEERRRFFIPWRSKCRACALMRLYREISEEKGGLK